MKSRKNDKELEQEKESQGVPGNQVEEAENLNAEEKLAITSDLSPSLTSTVSPSPLVLPLPHPICSTSSSSSHPSNSPNLSSCKELGWVLGDRRLTLDVYKGGSGILETLWDTVPEQVMEVQYLRLGSEEKDGLGRAFGVLPHLTLLRSLAIRGNRHQDSLGMPFPGLLSNLPPSLSSLTLLTHLDLSFNRLLFLPSCLLSLPILSTLLLSYNLLSTLPPSLGNLRSLSYISVMGNQLRSLPASLGQLGALQTLDLSHNLLESLPLEIGDLQMLRRLEVSHNKLRELPETLESLVTLRELMVHSNNLIRLPECLHKLPHLKKLDVRNNPLGPPISPPLLPPNPTAETKNGLPELHLGANQHCFSLSATGCHVFLPRGAELLFPVGCVATVTQLKWAERIPDRKWVWLGEHDFLLSFPLELLPHGIVFQKPVEVCIPYHRARSGEVVVRRFDGRSWSTLHTVTRRGSPKHSFRPGRRPPRLACCSVSQFSWFLVVSRPLTDSCTVSPEGACLVSSVDPGIKLLFPPHSTVQTRTVTLQVLQVGLSEVRALSSDSQASISPLLCLSQFPDVSFLHPVKVQIPLPPGLTGNTVDVSCLYLLHGDPADHTWTDVTSQASLNVSHLYATFTVTRFSWYWLWYTTQRCVSGMVRKVYHRLRQFRVQFMVLQRKMDPEQVLLQCLPSDKVKKTVEYLSTQYDGPQPSEICNLLEGEQFFAGFEKGIEINTDRPDCIDGRLSFVFYSHLKNHKEVYICPSQGQLEPVRGQVSFYRGEVPYDVPLEVAQKRKGPDSQWLATLPLRLPGINSQTGGVEETKYPPLHLGDPENGYLTEANLLAISLQIGQEWKSIGINLGMSYLELDRIEYKHRTSLGNLVLEMLFHWAKRRVGTGPGAVPELIEAMIESGRQDLADEIKDIVVLGSQKYKDSLRRVGLEPSSLTGI